MISSRGPASVCTVPAGSIGLVLRAFGDSSQASLEPAVKLEVAGAGTIRQVAR